MSINLPFPAKELEELESTFSFASNEIYYYNTHRPTALVQKLQNRNDEFDPNLVPRIFESALHEQLETYQISKFMGTGHVIYFARTKSGKDLVLRATHGLPSPELYMEMEQWVIARYKEVGINSVEILTSDAGRKEFEFDYQIMRPLPGKDPEVEWEGSQEDYDQLSFNLGRMIARQYSLPAKGWGRWIQKNGQVEGALKSRSEYLNAYIEHDLGVLRLFDVINEQAADTLRVYFKSKDVEDLFSDTTQGYFIHHDVADHNIRYRGSEVVALFDWECAVVCDPVSDLAAAPTWKVQYPREKKLTDGFIAELGTIPDNLESKVAVYLLRTMLWKVAFALKGKRLAEKHVRFLRDAIARCGLSIEVKTHWVN